MSKIGRPKCREFESRSIAIMEFCAIDPHTMAEILEQFGPKAKWTVHNLTQKKRLENLTPSDDGRRPGLYRLTEDGRELCNPPVRFELPNVRRVASVWDFAQAVSQ